MPADILEVIETRPDVGVQEKEYKRLLGLPNDFEMNDRTAELAAWARNWYARHGRPWIYARRVASLDIAGEKIGLDGTSFHSAGLSSLLKRTNADGAFVVAVSAGKECEEYARSLWQDERPDEYFFLEIYGSAVVEHLIAQASFQLCAWADRESVSVLPHLSPGYSGWDIADQVRLLSIISRNGAQAMPGPLGSLPSGMLTPKKSLLAVFGISPHVASDARLAGHVPCDTCSLPGCSYRRTPYRRPLPQPEPLAKRAVTPSQEPAPSYSFKPQVLDKWSQERLTLTTRADGGIEAIFRFSGTTCSNMGRPLEFHYLVSLAPAREQRRILDARCVPAPGDEGHKAMCEYRDTGGALMGTIAGEKPLVGQPLRSVFSWKRDYSPSGCYCNEIGRLHKWGMAYEVIAYALNKIGTDN